MARSRRETEESASSNSKHRDDIESGRKRRKKIITEEDLVEYMTKKALNKALKNAKKLKSQEVPEYSNVSNPFGDVNLNETFVWRKKIERDIIQGMPLDAYSLEAEKKRQQERMGEIEKAKKRREQRALEKAQHEEQMALLARERARAEFQDWEKKEEEFLYDQSKVRSEIRLREGRAKPIDVLTKNLNPSDDMDVETKVPYMVFKDLKVKEMEELRDDIKMHLDLDRATTTHTKYWEALLIVCDWKLAKAPRKDALNRARVRGEQPPQWLLAEERGLHSSIEKYVKKTLRDMSHKELEECQAQIESKMQSGKAKVVEFWEAILKRLRICKAKAWLREIHAEEEEENDNAEAAAGSFSPELVCGVDGEDVIDPLEDKSLLERKRVAVLEEQKRKMQKDMASKAAPPEQNLEMSAMKVMGSMEEGDAMFGPEAEINLDSQVYWWHDKYRPRKPKYINQVRTGYEWNKYNRTHYDNDNPPPKAVQGYKFEIFYPDLADKNKAPTYTIEKDGNSNDTCIIRFHGGPPYEDIAFRIVNKEWEYSRKKGYKCTFERGILHLNFNFERHFYRR